MSVVASVAATASVVAAFLAPDAPAAAHGPGDRPDFPGWFDRAGAGVAREVLHSAHAGPCGNGESSRTELLFAAFTALVYAYDPDEDLSPTFTVLPYEGNTALPPIATDTGYRQDDRNLWIVTGLLGVYVVLDEGTVQFWPQVRPGFTCA